MCWRAGIGPAVRKAATHGPPGETMYRCSAGMGTVSSGHGLELRVSGMAQVAFIVI